MFGKRNKKQVRCFPQKPKDLYSRRDFVRRNTNDYFLLSSEIPEAMEK